MHLDIGRSSTAVTARTTRPAKVPSYTIGVRSPVLEGVLAPRGHASFADLPVECTRRPGIVKESGGAHISCPSGREVLGHSGEPTPRHLAIATRVT
jgi:hypothetical protein